MADLNIHDKALFQQIPEISRLGLERKCLAWWALALHGQHRTIFLEMRQSGEDGECANNHFVQPGFTKNEDIRVPIDVCLVKSMWFAVLNLKFKFYEQQFVKAHASTKSTKKRDSFHEAQYLLSGSSEKDKDSAEMMAQVGGCLGGVLYNTLYVLLESVSSRNWIAPAYARSTLVDARSMLVV